MLYEVITCKCIRNGKTSKLVNRQTAFRVAFDDSASKDQYANAFDFFAQQIVKSLVIFSLQAILLGNVQGFTKIVSEPSVFFFISGSMGELMR